MTASAMSVSTPTWSTPDNLTQLLKADGEVEIDGWSPLIITAMTGTAYQGRPIETAWQISLDAGEAPNGQDLDGYGWEKLISDTLKAKNPRLEEKCHWDPEMSTFVVWVEAEADCRALAEIAWAVIHS
jgi:Immunity protein 51